MTEDEHIEKKINVLFEYRLQYKVPPSLRQKVNTFIHNKKCLFCIEPRMQSKCSMTEDEYIHI